MRGESFIKTILGSPRKRSGNESIEDAQPCLLARASTPWSTKLASPRHLPCSIQVEKPGMVQKNVLKRDEQLYGKNAGDGPCNAHEHSSAEKEEMLRRWRARHGLLQKEDREKQSSALGTAVGAIPASSDENTRLPDASCCEFASSLAVRREELARELARKFACQQRLWEEQSASLDASAIASSTPSPLVSSRSPGEEDSASESRQQPRKLSLQALQARARERSLSPKKPFKSKAQTGHSLQTLMTRARERVDSVHAVCGSSVLTWPPVGHPRQGDANVSWYDT
jgi:hypothetical protein